jgi:carbamoyl-phosphate synthase small subunit
VWAEGFVVAEASRLASNWRSKQTIHEYLVEAGVVAIEGIDTRALTRHLREKGSQQGIITHGGLDKVSAITKAREAPSIVGRDLAGMVTCERPYEWERGSGRWVPDGQQAPRFRPDGRPWHVVAYDFGIKQNILRRLADVGCRVTVVPAGTRAEEIEARQPDGVFLSNGPGDPEGVPYAVKEVKKLIGRYPIFGICLGHQILGLAFGLKTYKLKFGHHGANHPVIDLRTKKVEITSQNHNFAVAIAAPFEPGPHDAAYLFEEFVRLMETHHA